MLLVFVEAVLGYFKVVIMGEIVKQLHLFFGCKVSIAAHVGKKNLLTSVLSLIPNVQRPVFPPFYRFTGFIVHAIQNIGVTQRYGKQLIDKCLLMSKGSKNLF